MAEMITHDCAGLAEEQVKAGARLRRQEQLLTHRQAEVLQQQENIPLQSAQVDADREPGDI